MRKLLFLILVIGGLVGYLGWNNRVSLVSDYLSRKLGAPAAIDDLEISTHGLVVRNLRLAPPDGHVDNPVLLVQYLRARFSPFAVFSNPMKLSEVRVAGVIVMIPHSPWNSFKPDWSLLLDKLGEIKEHATRAGRAGRQVAVSTEPSVDKERRYIIEHLLVEDVYLVTDAQSGGPLGAPAIRKLELYDVGKDSPRTLPQTLQVVLGAIFEQTAALSGDVRGLLEQVRDGADRELKNVLDSLRKSDGQGKSWWKSIKKAFGG